MDCFVRPEILVCRKAVSAFHLCGLAGVTVACLESILLTARSGGSQGLMVLVILCSIFIFLGVSLMVKAVTGVERLVYYDCEIAVLVAAAILLRLLNQPILPTLDITVLGIGTFLVFGRVGCFMVGCCHGRPSRLGVRYRGDFARYGFPHYLVDVRLFPIQLVESAAALVIVAFGVVLILRHAPAGAAFALYVMAYGMARFLIEFLRGDAGRPYFLGFSRPQWFSLVLIGFTVIEEARGTIPFDAWHVSTLAAIALTMMLVSLGRKHSRTDRFGLLQPCHIREVAEALAKLDPTLMGEDGGAKPSGSSAPIQIARTSLGVCISADRTGGVLHYTVSRRPRSLNWEAAAVLGDVVAIFLREASRMQLIKADGGVFHLLARSSAPV
jgi:hypothetical protein